MAARPGPPRTHIVLVPGFGGFDALGQIEYYAGVTPAFQGWRASSSQVPAGRRERTALHYFDSLPTAGVATRAAWLEAYLLKRVARGEFQPGDRLALVGHSTGGLDIRQVIRNLAAEPAAPRQVDGGQGGAVPVPGRAILEMLERVAFLSVPQRGTNIADWVQLHALTRRSAVEGMRAALAANAAPPVALLERWSTWALAGYTGADLLLAVNDALRESRPAEDQQPAERAGAREAAAELGLWLRNIAEDFSAIADLACEPASDHSSPARAREPDRAAELATWRAYGIATRSYATLGRCPFDPGEVPAWRTWNPWGLSALGGLGLLGRGADGTDAVYRACYRACCAGPFQAAPQPVRLPDGSLRKVEAWENDGIVNTASMLWPDGEATLLVDGDHGDIIGHYRRSEAAGAPRALGRQHHSYDLLGSASGFGPGQFRAVWHGVFDFCTA